MPTASLSASNMTELLAAIDTALATDPGTDWTVYLDDGDYGTPAGKVFISSKVFAGQVIDPNAGLPISERDPNAVATALGGSIRFRARRSLRSRITDQVQVTGSGPFLWVGIDFSASALADGGLQADGSYRKSESHVKSQISHTFNSTHPARIGMVLRKCRFGGSANGIPAPRWIMGVTTAGTADALTVIEDCEFSGVTIGGSAIVVRRNSVRKQVTDGFRMGFATGPQPDLFCYGNTIFDSSTDPVWSREHSDAVQIGSINTDWPCYVEVYDNVICAMAKMQGIYTDDSAAAIGGVIQDNLIVVTNTNGVHLWRAGGDRGLLVQGNTVVRYPDGVDSHNLVLTRVNANGTQATAIGNLAMNELADPTKPWLQVSDHEVVDFTGPAYSAAFAGDFGVGVAPFSPVNLSQSAASLRTQLLNLFSRV